MSNPFEEFVRLFWSFPLLVTRECADALLPQSHKTQTHNTTSSPPPLAPALPAEHPQPNQTYNPFPAQAREPQLFKFQTKQTNNNMSSTAEFYDTSLYTVDYQILFVKRDKEALLEKGTTIVAKTMTGGNFDAWKIAQFIEELTSEGIHIPQDWRGKNLDSIVSKWGEEDPEKRKKIPENKRLIKGLKPESLEYLDVRHQIVSTVDRRQPHYEEKKTEALERIADTIGKC